LKKNDLALKDLDMALDLDPNFKYYHNKGLAYQDCNNYEQAIKMFEKALELSADHVPSQYHLALMNHKSGNLQEALK
jgi:tetratricopeptide (TPR) repeat protein